MPSRFPSNLLLLVLFTSSSLSLVSSAATGEKAQEKPCTIHQDGKFYDLTPLQASKDYEFKTQGGHQVVLNVCRSVRHETWGLDVEDPGEVSAFIRKDHGDFSGFGGRREDVNPVSHQAGVRSTTAPPPAPGSNVNANGQPSAVPGFGNKTNPFSHQAQVHAQSQGGNGFVRPTPSSTSKPTPPLPSFTITPISGSAPELTPTPPESPSTSSATPTHSLLLHSRSRGT